MTSRSVSESVSNRPRLYVAPRTASTTYGDLAADLAGDYGLRPDGWQQIILDDWLAEVRGQWASLTCGLSVPRQNGKNGVLEMRELFGTVGRGEKFVHTAHQVKTAQKHFRRLKHFFGRKVDDPTAHFPELNALVAELRNVNGQEAIYLHNGGSIEIVARSQGSGRGYTVDVIVCDEAQDMSDDDLEALLSTSSAAPLGNPQWIFIGTPPGPRADGEVFTRVRAEALEGKARRTCWHEWSCEPGVDLDSHDAWHQANPALGTRLQFDVVEGERSALSEDGFARERLGMWTTAGTTTVIDAQSWALVADEESRADDRLVLAVDINPERSMAAVSMAGRRSDGLAHFELDEHRAGTGWVVPWLTDRWLTDPISTVVIDGAGPAASLIDELRRNKVKVVVTSYRDMQQACAGFFDAVMNRTLRHIGQPQLAVALAAARKRPLGDAWAWNRKNSSSDITPLVAATLALWGTNSTSVKARRPANREGSRVLVLN